MIGRPGCLIPGLAISNKKPNKRRYTRHRGPVEFLTVRQLDANDAIPRPVLNSTLQSFLTLAHVQSEK